MVGWKSRNKEKGWWEKRSGRRKGYRTKKWEENGNKIKRNIYMWKETSDRIKNWEQKDDKIKKKCWRGGEG